MQPVYFQSTNVINLINQWKQLLLNASLEKKFWSVVILTVAYFLLTVAYFLPYCSHAQ